jgi:hypothetical protein
MTPNTDFLTGLAIGAFIVGLIWACFDLRAKNKQLGKFLTELRVDDEFDPDDQAFLKKTHRVTQ